jgi:hypothetical protein
MTSPASDPNSVTSLIRREVHVLFNPQLERYLLTLQNGLPVWTESAAQATSWFTQAAAVKVAAMVDAPLAPVPVRYVRPAADPLGWRFAND